MGKTLQTHSMKDKPHKNKGLSYTLKKKKLNEERMEKRQTCEKKENRPSRTLKKVTMDVPDETNIESDEKLVTGRGTPKLINNA